MSAEDFNERRADAKSEGFDDIDARRIANGQRLSGSPEPEYPCLHCGSPIDEPQSVCPDCQLIAQQEAAAEEAERNE